MLSQMNITEILLRIPAILLALSVHEFAHGFAAYKLGDMTAKTDGRLSLNPLRHIDPIGLICLLLFRFGWAKPVMVNPSYFKDPKTDMALTAFAGPLSNILFSFIALLIYYPLWHFYSHISGLGLAFMLLEELFFLNLTLGIFNMLPIPPLDGSKIFTAVLPDHLYYRITANSRIGFVILMLLMWTGGFSYVLNPLMSTAYKGLLFLAEKIYFFL